MPRVVLARCPVISFISLRLDLSSAIFESFKDRLSFLSSLPLLLSLLPLAGQLLTGWNLCCRGSPSPTSFLLPLSSSSVFFLLLLFCLLESFLEGSFDLTPQSVQFSNSQVSVWEKEVNVVLILERKLNWFEIETGALLYISISH